MDGIRAKYGLSERHACRIVGQHRGTQRYMPSVQADEDGLTRAIVALASEYGRYGYRRVTALLAADRRNVSVQWTAANLSGDGADA